MRLLIGGIFQPTSSENIRFTDSPEVYVGAVIVIVGNGPNTVPVFFLDKDLPQCNGIRLPVGVGEGYTR